MGQKVVDRSFMAVNSLPPDIQHGDIIQVKSPTGKVRGSKTKRTLIEALVVIFIGYFAVWPFTVIGVKAGIRWALFGLAVAVLWGAVMGYMLGRSSGEQ